MHLLKLCCSLCCDPDYLQHAFFALISAFCCPRSWAQAEWIFNHICDTFLANELQWVGVSLRDTKVQVDVLVLDFSKTFDTVPHDRLLGKLEHYGISGPILNWINVFLKTREQRVQVGGAFSSPTSVNSGVPQGMILEPLLFLLHINDLPQVVSSQVRLFADDCLLYRGIRCREDQLALQRDLTTLSNWGDTWGMKFNAAKCNIMPLTDPSYPVL